MPAMPRRCLLPALALAAAASSLVACQRHGYVVPGEEVLPAVAPLVPADADPAALRDARARPRPHLEVEPAGSIDARGRLGRVAAHEVIEGAGLRRLEVDLEPEGRVAVTYSLPGDHAIPAAQGDEIALRLVPPEAEGDFRGRSLLVWTRQGRLLAAMAVGGGLPRGTLGPSVDVGPSRRLVYSDVRRLPGLCVVVEEHFEARIQEEGSFRYLPPGTMDHLVIDERPYRLLVLDVARPEAARCAGAPDGTLAFVVLAVVPEAGSAPAGRQDEPAAGRAARFQIP